MVTMRVAALLVFASCLCLGAWIRQPAATPRCSVSVTPSRADHGSAILLAQAAPDTVFVGVETLPSFLQEGQPTRFPPRSGWAQSFHVEDLVGRGQPLRDEFGPGFQAFLIPWGDDDINCLPGPWNGSAAWVGSSYRAVHLAWLRPRSQWVNDTPTFDVPFAMTQPYGFEGDTVPRGHNPPFGVMSASELFELNRLLTASPDSLAAVQAFRQWALANPDDVRKYPASQMSQWWPR